MGEETDSGFKDLAECWPYIMYPACAKEIVSPTMAFYILTSIISLYFFVNIIRNMKLSELDNISRKSISFWIFSTLTFILQVVQVFYESPTFTGVWNNITVYVRNVPFLLIADQSIEVAKLMGKKYSNIISYLVDFLYFVVFLCVVSFYIVQMSIMNDDNCWSIILIMWYSGTFFEIFTKLVFIFCLIWTFVIESGAVYLIPNTLRRRMKIIAFLTSLIVLLWTIFQFALNYYVINISVILRGLYSSMVPIYSIHSIHIILEYSPMLMLIIASLFMGAIGSNEANEDNDQDSSFDLTIM